jgi:hypothetical protein
VVAVLVLFGAIIGDEDTPSATDSAAPVTTTTETPTVTTESTTTTTTTTTVAPKPKPTPKPKPKPRVTLAAPAKPKPAANCDPNYSGCVPVASDVDCAGGSGNGPAYATGPVEVVGEDVYGLDRDGDGTACD